MRCRAATASKLEACLPKTLWTPLESLLVSTKSRLKCRCVCGTVRAVRVRDLVSGSTYSCRACSSRARMLAVPQADRVALCTRASDAARRAIKARTDTLPLYAEFGRDVVTALRARGVRAKQRCTNPNDAAYGNYGARGIEFRFPSSMAFAEWVLRNIGPAPSPDYSLDRIDNNRHYEPGNLRWATRTEQASNRRVFKLTQNGERLRRLAALRPDLTYETIRQWVKQGATDESILQRAKYTRTSL